MKRIGIMVIVLGMLPVPMVLQARVENLLQNLIGQFNWSGVSGTDSVVQIIAEQAGLPSVTPDQWPSTGTCWYVEPGARD